MPKLDDELSAVDIQRIKLQAHKLIRTMSGDITKNTRTLVNNLQAANGRSVVENLTGINEIKFNLSLN
jgi:hypothetical protein